MNREIKDMRCAGVVGLGIVVIVLSIIKLDGWAVWLNIMIVIAIILSTDNSN